MNFKYIIQWIKRNTLVLIIFFILLFFLVFVLIPYINEYFKYIEVFLLILSISLTSYKVKLELTGPKTDISHPETNETLGNLKKVPTRLIGRKEEVKTILKDFKMGTRPRVISIQGIRGQGKTTLIEEVAKQALLDDTIKEMYWETAKIEKLVGPRIKKLRKKQENWKSIKDKFEQFKQLNPNKPILFILENIDSIDKPNELIIRLPDIIGENLCIITSREKICHQLVRPVLLKGMNDDECVEFIELQAKILHNNTILHFKKEKLLEISRELGGNPLALKLLVVLSNFLPLNSAYERIIQGDLDLEYSGGSIFTYIYKDIWKNLSPSAKEILFYIDEKQNDCEIEDIKGFFSSKYQSKEVEDSIASLLKECLIDINQEKDECLKYEIDPLTRNFLKTSLPSYWDSQMKNIYNKMLRRH